VDGLVFVVSLRCVLAGSVVLSMVCCFCFIFGGRFVVFFLVV